MVASLTRMPWKTLVAENTQIAPNTWLPQKCPPSRASEKFWMVVGGLAPKPSNGNPKFSELIVRPE